MKTVLIFILLICLVLSLYGFIFNKGEALNFEQLYKGCLTYVTDIGNAFNTFRDALVDLIEGNVDIGKAIADFSVKFINKFTEFTTNMLNGISDFAIDVVDGIGQFFVDLWTNIANFFGVCGHIGTECPENCNCQCKECV